MRRDVVVVAAALSVATLAGCGSSQRTSPPPPPATLESVPGTASVRVHLTADAADALGLRTATIVQQVVGGRPQLAALGATIPAVRLTVPASAVVYRPTGAAYVFVVVGPLAYQREPVVVDYLVNDEAVLVSGPPDGTPVITVGAAEVLGAELGVGGAELG
jgi:hypothetical protein